MGSTGLQLLAALTLVPSLAHAQQDAWSEAELRASCIPAGAAVLQTRATDCLVRDFGKLPGPAGAEAWYALYSNFAEPLSELATASARDFPNVLVLFAATQDGAQLAPFRVINPEGSFYNQYDAPELVVTPIGPVLHATGYGMGDGRSQFEYDVFFLWRDDAWTELDATGWIPEVKARLPQGLQLDGIYKDRFDLAKLSYTDGPVRRDDDCHNCASGGRVQVELGLRGNSLVLKEFRYSAP